MDGRKLRKKRKINSRKKKMGYQEFIDKINSVLKERKEMEELFSRILVLKSESVLEEMEIKRRNNEILQAHIRKKALEALSNTPPNETGQE